MQGEPAHQDIVKLGVEAVVLQTLSLHSIPIGSH